MTQTYETSSADWFEDEDGNGNGQPGQGEANVGDKDRLISLVGGGALALLGLSRRSVGGVALAAAGGALIYRGVTRRDPIYERLKISTAGKTRAPNSSVAHLASLRVERSIMINKPAEEIYRFWREASNLARFQTNLESVSETGPNRQHWVAKGPGGKKLEWDAEIINDKPGELIAWRTLEGADVPSAGSVQFRSAGSGTEVKVEMQYQPPAGAAGDLVSKITGDDPDKQTQKNLEELKRLMEGSGSNGSTASSSGQTTP